MLEESAVAKDKEITNPEDSFVMSDKSKDFVHFEPLSLGGGVSIDTSGSDNGFLVCARTGWTNPPGDSNCAQAAANLARYRRSPSARDVTKLVLVGHGNSGLISTGDGMTPSTVLGYISAGNYNVWQPYFAQLYNHGTFLTLCGCDCGADAAGATFLYQLATLLNRPVRGRTGLVFLSCPGAYISYENGSVWQVAQPGIMPTPIPKPSAKYELPGQAKLKFGSSPLIDLEAVFQIELEHQNGSKNTLESASAQSLAAAGNLSRMAYIEGSIGAVVTGHMVVSAEVKRRRFNKRLVIYNDRVLQDADNSSLYYFCSAAFTEEIRNLRLSKQ